ncbi:GNAT family N-acetyltransferase [Pseudoalteromonas ulvae]|uniref:BioF2-like acetyltransferase domain-containing protein n=1 Tax=Pseudoalteromonas ulvae TaxID=107327 RepID=A0A244CLQ0_PSEDV|nr:GNAT family N-acetyltransferase [Pseudoalteromonas ulvae]OUL56553.1 hypothetical protein B1199_18000 [Pseudoalteromonas ulvae]
MSKMNSIALKKYTLKNDRPFIMASWQTLLTNSDHSYFQSLEWMHAWLTHLPEHQDLDFWLMTNHNEPLAGLVIGTCSRKFLGVKPLVRAVVQGVGLEEFDLITPEYTGLVYNDLEQVDFALWSDTLLNHYHEVLLPYTSPVQSVRWINQKQAHCLYHEATYYADLNAFKDGESSFWQSISKNTKKQLKASLNAYEKMGSLKIEAAKDKTQAKEFLHELGKLSSLKWDSTNKKGAFDQQQFIVFHQNLIDKSFNNGHLQLLKVTAAEHVIGYLYNFIYQGSVYFYQCGFVYLEQNKFRPGLVCHYLCMQLNASKGALNYDFLAGDNRYKQSFATKQENMPTLLLQRNNWYLKLEKTLILYLKRLKKFQFKR